jgi:hypothetical protein
VIANLLDVETRTQRLCRIASLLASAIWGVGFIVVVLVRPTSGRWLALFAPLAWVFAVDQIVNRAWYSRTFTRPVKRSPAFWVAMGILVAAWGVMAVVVAALAAKSPHV